MEALEKQLRDRKETQYKLVEGKRRADEQVAALEAKSKAIFEKYGKLDAHLQHETQVKRYVLGTSECVEHPSRCPKKRETPSQ